MKKTYLTLILLFVFFHATIAQSKNEKAIATAVEQLTEGMLDGNKQLLDAITAKDLTYGHSSGTLENKQEFVEALVSKKSNFTRIDILNQTINMVGDIALVRHVLNGDVNGNTVNLGVLLVWTKEGKAWKLLARQAYKL